MSIRAKNIIPIILLISLGWQSCSQPKMLDAFTFQLNGISNDPTYGYTENNPIKVGVRGNEPKINEFRYINALKGPDGEEIIFRELGDCWKKISSKRSKKKILGQIKIYEVTYDSLSRPIILFINNYEYKPLYAPIGFTFENSAGIDNKMQVEKLNNPTPDLSNKDMEQEDFSL